MDVVCASNVCAVDITCANVDISEDAFANVDISEDACANVDISVVSWAVMKYKSANLVRKCSLLGVEWLHGLELFVIRTCMIWIVVKAFECAWLIHTVWAFLPEMNVDLSVIYRIWAYSLVIFKMFLHD